MEIDATAAALAGNPAAPAGVLLRLLGVGGYEVVERLRWRTTMPDEVAVAMARHPDRRVRHALAESWTAAPEHRALLLDGPPSDAMVLAGGAVPYRAEVAPLPDWAYERLLAHERGMVRYEAVNAPTVPAHVLVPLAAHEDPLFRLAACRRVWHELDDGVRRALLDDGDHAVRTAAALHVMAEDEERTAVLAGELADDWRLAEVLERGRLSRALAEELLDRGERLWALALNPTFPDDLAARLAAHEDPRVRLSVSARPGLTDEQRAAVAWTVAPEDRLDTLWWVWRSRHDPDVLRRCAASAHPWLRRSAAVCAELPADAVGLLARDDDFAVRLLLAERHPGAPPELLLDLYLHEHGTHRAVFALTSRPRFPARGLAARFADAGDPQARALAVRDPDAPPALLDRLSRDPDGRVAGPATGDPRLPLPRLLELLDDPRLGMFAAYNPALPVARMHALLDRAGVPR
ncbi:hypothetical protein [Streptomyces genisteinicus]|uniref:PE-PGRS family protein n=1 Tax=Streptomyces genisteinicus TaxID=2768068 RepID=A0A7H0HR11_9ACTN|nr:hypothetical protein [Streptomyces genisteinicus]QNP62977.1 hypothetical protein IAG43_08485 [Streptomyces genisteinicus]